jgi:hypothetical protein
MVARVRAPAPPKEEKEQRRTEMEEKKDKAFLDFMYVLQETFAESGRAALAFWLAVWWGEAARARAIKSDDPNPAPETFAFELGLQLRPVWTGVDASIKSALVSAAVGAILNSVGIGKK